MEVFFRKFEISFFFFFFDREFVWIKVRRIFEYLERERERKGNINCSINLHSLDENQRY